MKLIKTTILAAVAALGLAVNASAVPLSVGDQYYLGAIVDGVPPGSNELPWVNQLAGLPSTNPNPVGSVPAGETLYRSGNNFGLTTPYTLPTALSAIKSENPAQGTYVVGGSSLYLLGKYGNFTLPSALGGTGQVSHVWYIGGITIGTELTLPGSSLSHDTIFNGTRFPPVNPPGVPEGGVSVMLLGSALIGLGAIRRFLRR